MKFHTNAFYPTDLKVELVRIEGPVRPFIVCKWGDSSGDRLDFLPNIGMTLDEQVITLRKVAHSILEQLEEIDAQTV